MCIDLDEWWEHDAELIAELDAVRMRDLARSIRLTVVQNLYNRGLLSDIEADGILRGPLRPGDLTTVVDDRDQLRRRNIDVEIESAGNAE